MHSNNGVRDVAAKFMFVHARTFPTAASWELTSNGNSILQSAGTRTCAYFTKVGGYVAMNKCGVANTFLILDISFDKFSRFTNSQNIQEVVVHTRQWLGKGKDVPF